MILRRHFQTTTPYHHQYVKGLKPHAVQFAICCRMLYSLPFVAALSHAIQFAICCCTATCCTICCLLPRTVQFAVCCRILTACSLLPHAIQFAFLPHAIQFANFVAVLLHTAQFEFFAACHAVYYLLLHAVQFAICCCMPCSMLLVAARCTVFYLLLHTIQFSLLPHAIQFCCMLPHACCTVAIFHSMMCGLLFIAACHTGCY